MPAADAEHLRRTNDRRKLGESKNAFTFIVLGTLLMAADGQIFFAEIGPLIHVNWRVWNRPAFFDNRIQRIFGMTIR